MIPIIYKPTRVTRKTATTMYHTLSLIVLLKQSLTTPFLKVIHSIIFFDLFLGFIDLNKRGKQNDFYFASIESFKKKLYETH